MGDGFTDDDSQRSDGDLGTPDTGIGAAPAVASSSSGASSSGSSKPASGKRSPGRPRKSASSSTSTRGQNDPIRLRVDEAGHARQPAAKPSKPKTNDQTGDATQATTALLQLVELAAVVSVGPHAAFNPIERAMVEPAMVRVLARMDASAVAKYGALADPIVLALGLGMWGMRIWASRPQQRPGSESADRAASGFGHPTQAAEPPKTAPEEAASGAVNVPNPHQANNGYAPISPLVLANVDTDLGPVF